MIFPRSCRVLSVISALGCALYTLAGTERDLISLDYKYRSIAYSYDLDASSIQEELELPDVVEENYSHLADAWFMYCTWIGLGGWQ